MQRHVMWTGKTPGGQVKSPVDR